VGAPETKGSGFVSAVGTLRKMVAPDAFERLLAELSEETAALVRRPPLPVAWIASERFQELLRTAAELFGGDEAAIEDWGRRALLFDLKGIYKMFIRFLSPQFVIDRSAKLWATYTQNNGRVRAVATGARSAEVTYEDLPVHLVSDAFWAYQRGAMRGAMEATGMKDIVVETLEGGGAAGHARFRISWG
jgi:hypothetical protein